MCLQPSVVGPETAGLAVALAEQCPDIAWLKATRYSVADEICEIRENVGWSAINQRLYPGFIEACELRLVNDGYGDALERGKSIWLGETHVARERPEVPCPLVATQMTQKVREIARITGAFGQHAKFVGILFGYEVDEASCLELLREGS